MKKRLIRTFLIGVFLLGMSECIALISCLLPVIDVSRLDAQTRQIRIERAYPSAKFGRGADPRFDNRIRKVLEETGKLRHSKSNKGHAETTVPPSEAARD